MEKAPGMPQVVSDSGVAPQLLLKLGDMRLGGAQLGVLADQQVSEAQNLLSPALQFLTRLGTAV
ncbi:MAG: hypothetical protein AABM43_04880 [Actinomycetota bacterium]